MDRDPYTIALSNAVTEIKRAYPEINNSFIFTKNNETITGETETDRTTVKSIQEALQAIKEKSQVIGDVKSFQVYGKNANLTVTNIEDVYLVLETSQKMDTTQIYSITHVIIPTILRTLENFTSPHLQSTTPSPAMSSEPEISPEETTLEIAIPQKKLVVETVGGFFAGDSVQIDTEILTDWTMDADPRARVKAAITGEQLVQKAIEQVRIETFGGSSASCKVKEVNDKKLKGRNVIKIPEKVCKSLEIKNGDLVKVRPM